MSNEKIYRFSVHNFYIQVIELLLYLKLFIYVNRKHELLLMALLNYTTTVSHIKSITIFLHFFAISPQQCNKAILI